MKESCVFYTVCFYLVMILSDVLCLCMYATKTAPVRPADTWRQTGKWTKTALQAHHQAQHESLRDYHRYMGASGSGAIYIPRFPTQRSNASRGDQSGTREGEAPPSQGSYIARSWRPDTDMFTLWSSIHCTDWTLRPLKVEALTQPHRPLHTPCSSRCCLQVYRSTFK